MRMQLRVSGASWSAAIEGSAVPSEESWPTPTRRRVGRGESYVYDVNPETADLIISHLSDVALGLMGSSDPDAQRDHRAIMLDVRRAQANR